jgi:hypothetical protein
VPAVVQRGAILLETAAGDRDQLLPGLNVGRQERLLVEDALVVDGGKLQHGNLG